jgi:hypothetical protein
MRSKAKPKSLGDLLRKAKAEAAPAPRKLSRAKEPALVVRSLALTPAADATLQRLSAETSARIGRKISGSAIVRALLRQAEQQDSTARLLPHLMLELSSGAVVWGKERKS